MWLFPSLCSLLISGFNFANVLTNVASLDYLGCYKENTEGPRLLTGYNQNFPDSLTPELCIKLCVGRGFQYAGLQYKIECYCDNELPSPNAVSTDGCTSACSGDPNKVCGGTWRISLYYTGLQTVTKYLGCYKENPGDRSLMQGFQQNFLESLTPQKCIFLCYSKGFHYAGMQSRVQCFCDHERPKIKSSAHESECNAHCSGNGHLFCGGILHLSVYETGLEGPTLGAIENYVGCFKDQPNIKLLTGLMKDFGDNLTPERCVALCYRLGHLYAGLQNTTICQCGDAHPMPAARTDEKECFYNCSGDKLKVCGSENKLSIYGTGITDIPAEGKLVGCFKDDGNERVLDGNKVDLENTNSPRRCVNLCLLLGFNFAGVQNGKECFCGDKRPGINLGVGDNHCNISCSGDTAYNCGGLWRISIYRTGYIDNIVVPLANHFEPTPLPLPLLSTEIPTTSNVTELSTNNLSITSVTTAVIDPLTTPDTYLGQLNTLESPVDKCELSQTIVNGRKACKGETIFSETFLNELSDKWQHTVKIADTPDFEFVVYNKNETNIYVSNGKLIIKPTILSDETVKSGKLQLEKCTGQPMTRECELEAKSYIILPPIQTARISTKQTFSFRYGVVEIRAKLPSGDWLVPELWLQPTNRVYGPEYASGLIRIAMARGNRDLYLKSQNIGCKQMESGLLMGNVNVRGRAVLRELDECWSNKYHNYTVIWTPENISFMVDGEQKNSLITEKEPLKLSEIVGFTENQTSVWNSGSSIAPFDKDFHLTLGLSVGGARNFPDGSVNRGKPKPWKNFELKAMLNFWLDRNTWKNTWSEDSSSLEVKHIKVTAL